MDRRNFFIRGGAALVTASAGSLSFAHADDAPFDPEKAIQDLALDVPSYGPSEAPFQRFLQSGNLVFLSGTTPFVNRQRLHPGVVGEDVTLEQAQEAARRCAIQLLGVMRGALGGNWERLEQVLRIEGFVRSAKDFGDQPKVMNAASELMVSVLGDRGRHTRVAIGVNELPFESCVEIAATISVSAAS